MSKPCKGEGFDLMRFFMKNYYSNGVKIDNRKDAPKPENDAKFTTVFTDASYCYNTKSAGYAIWIKNNGEVISDANSIDNMQSAEEAELYALNRAVHILMANRHLTEDHIIVIQSDCINALNKLDISQLKLRSNYVKLKHVKGHNTRSGTKRSWVNNWCDRTAKKYMRQMRGIY